MTVATMLVDEHVNSVAGGERLEQLRLFDAMLEKLSRTGLFVKSTTYEVKPGRYLVRQVVREAKGSRISAPRTIVVIRSKAYIGAVYSHKNLPALVDLQ